MSLTPAQNATLKAAINASPTLSAYPNTTDGNQNMCNEQLNLNYAPTFTVWKNTVSITDTGETFDGTEWADLTTANIDRLTNMALWLPAGYNPSKFDIREMFDDIWSGAAGTITRPKLLALWKRAALWGEQILATGTGTDAVPATMSYVGTLAGIDVQTARNS